MRVRRRGALAHSELVKFREHFGLMRAEIFKAPLSCNAIHSTAAHSKERFDRLRKFLPKVGRQLFEVVALQKILFSLRKNTLSATGDSGFLGPGRPR